MYPSALPPCRTNQVYHFSTPDAILVRFLTDMGRFSHPKSPTTKPQLLKLPPSNFGIVAMPTVSSPAPDKAVVFLFISSAAPKSSWFLLGASLSADKGRGDEGKGQTTEIRRAGMDSLEIDEDEPEPAARAINRRPIINLNGGDDGSRSETPETFKAKHMQQEVGRLRKKKFHGGTTVMWITGIACWSLPACENRKINGKDTDRSC